MTRIIDEIGLLIIGNRRKFLVDGDFMPFVKKSIRITDDKGFLTIKGLATLSRPAGTPMKSTSSMVPTKGS